MVFRFRSRSENLTIEVQGRQLLSVRKSAIPERLAWGFFKTDEAKTEFPRVTALHNQDITQDITHDIGVSPPQRMSPRPRE